MPKPTLILGASKKPDRYAFLAAHMLEEYGHPILEVNREHPEIPDEEVHTVTVYLNERNQKQYEEALLKLKPERVIFNPGAENDELAGKLKQKGIEVENACTLVMLRTQQF